MIKLRNFAFAYTGNCSLVYFSLWWYNEDYRKYNIIKDR